MNKSLDETRPASKVKVSIVIPHFNRAELLTETLESVRRQTFTDWEVIVVDDGSTPEQMAIVMAFAADRITILQRTNGLKGPSRCRNLGAAASKGEYLIFVDSDDLLAPWCLESRLAFCFKNHDVGFYVFPVLLFKNVPGDVNSLWNTLDGADDLDRFIRSDPPWHTSSPLWKREAFETVGGFNEFVMYGDDSDLHMRALLHGISYCKSIDQMPDAFVRRADQVRITNTISESLLDSRMDRLEQGSLALKLQGTPLQCRVWQGQYFVEAEFLLFNVPNSKTRQRQVMEAWKANWQIGFLTSILIIAYFHTARATKKRFYLLLRIARRFVAIFFPEPFIFGAHAGASIRLTTEKLSELMQRLAVSSQYSKQ